MGIITNTPASYNGYTLLSNNEQTYLIDNCGELVNEWTSEYKTGHGLYLTKEGKLVRQGQLDGSFNAGGKGGVIEIYSWEGELEWQYVIADESKQAHHDLELLSNGNILCTVWDRKSEAEAKQVGRRYAGEVWSESIWELEVLPNNKARIVWEWSIWDHLIQNYDAGKTNYGVIKDHPELLDINYIGQSHEDFGNWLHFNAIDYNEALDQIVVSSRNLSEIYVIDHSTTRAEAATHTGGRYGKGGAILYRYGNPQVYDHGDETSRSLRGQHNIEWIKESSIYQGDFSVFNNEALPESQSEVLIFRNPANEDGVYDFVPGLGFGDESILRSYRNPSLYSDVLSGVQVLANDNLLILDGDSGRLLELNSDDEIVWEYIYPVNRNAGPGIQGATPRFNILFRALRYSTSFVGFKQKELRPMGPIELSPSGDDCEVFNATSAISEEPKLEYDFRLKSNLILDELVVYSDDVQRININIYDLSGQKMYTKQLSQRTNILNLSNLNAGMYLIQSRANVQKFVKL